jgi:hypothetical protein
VASAVRVKKSFFGGVWGASGEAVREGEDWVWWLLQPVTRRAAQARRIRHVNVGRFMNGNDT